MKHLKLFFACLLMAVLSIGQVWATSPDNYSFSSFSSSSTVNLTTTDGFTITLAKNNGGTDPAWASSQARVYAKGSLTITIPAASNYKITSVVYTYVVNKNKSNVAPTIDGVSGADDTGTWNSSSKTWTASGTGATSVTFSTSGTAGNVGFTAVSITYTSGGGGGSNNPTLSVKQGSTAIETLNVPAAGATSQTLTLEYANIKADSEGATPSISFYSNAACTSASSQEWFTATGTNKTTVTYSAGANNTGSTRSVYAVVSNTVKNTAGTDKTVRDTITISQVSLVPVTNISVKASTSLEVETTETLTATITPDNASDKSVTWSSDDEEIATVDENGKVTGVAIGTTNIKATANDGSGVYGSCAVTVKAALPKIIIDGEPLTSTATTQASTIKFGNAQKDSISVVLSDGAKYQTSTNATNHFGSQKSIFIGKADKYIYNSTPIPGNFKKFELYANYGASQSVTVSVTFSRYPLIAAGTGSDTLYTATLSTLDNVYDCSAKIPEGAKYFYYKVTNAYNSQVQFRITYEPITSPVTITAPTTGTGTLALANGQTAVASGDNIEAGTELTVTATPSAQNHYIGGTVTVTKTVGGDNVTEQVYNSTTGKITMPEYAITVSASFTPTYAITGASVTGGSFSWEDDQSNANPAYVAAGVYVQASAKADAGYVFGGTFNIYKTGTPATKVTDEDGLFEMPAYAVTIGGSFNEAPTITLSQTSTMAFTKVATEASTSAKFTVSAANLTAGSLSVSKSGTNADKFNLSTSSITLTDGAVTNAEVTVTPVTTATGDYTATIIVDDGNGGAAAQSFNVTLHVEDQYTAKWWVNGVEQTTYTVTDFSGTTLTFPDAPTPSGDCTGTVFKGWLTAPLAEASADEPDGLIKTYTGHTMPAATVNYYAVFAEQVSDGTEAGYSLSANAPAVEDGNVIIATKSGNTYYAVGTDQSAHTLTLTDGLISSSTSNIVWYLSAGTNGLYYADGTGNNPNYIHLNKSAFNVSTSTTNGELDCISNGDGSYKLKVVNSTNVRYLTYSTSYSVTDDAASATPIYIFKYSAATDPTYSNYVTSCVACSSVSLIEAGETNGTITLKEGSKAVNSVKTCNGAVTLTTNAVAATGYELTNITFSGTAAANVTKNEALTEIYIPKDATGELTVTATFSQKNYSISVVSDPASIGATLTGATSTAKYNVEQTISTTEPTGYLFGGWFMFDASTFDAENIDWDADLSEEIFTGTYEGENLELEASFLMPDKNLAAVAYFDKIYTVSEFDALSKTDGDYYVIEGLICNVESYSNSKYITYDISDNGVNSGTTLKIFKGLGLNGASFSADTDLKVGERVRVYGAWDNSHTDINQDSKLYYHQTLSVASVAIGGSAEKTAYSPSDNTFRFDGLTATATYNTGYVKDVTGEATWTANSANPYTVAATGDVTVKATFGGQYDEETVGVTYTTKTVKSIYLEYESTYTFKGYDLPKPKVYAKYVESIADDEITSLVEAANGYDTESAYNKNTPGNYTINVGYESFNAEYTVQVRKIFDNEDAPHNVADATALIVASAYQSTTSSTDYMWVRGKVSSQTQYNSSYYISDDGTTTGQLYVFSGKYFNNESFTADTKLPVGDEVIVKATILNYNGATPELTGSQVTYQLRDPAFAFADVVAGDEFEAGFSADMTVVPTSNEGEATFTLSSGNTDAVTIVDGKLHAVAEGDAEITASRAAMGESGEINYKAKNATFNVHVIAKRTRYAVTLNNGGATGGTAPATIVDQLEGAEVSLPECTWSWAQHGFTGWTVKETVFFEP